MSKRINTLWTKGLVKESTQRFKEQLLSNHAIFERLDKILEDCKIDPTQKDYGVPSWAFEQAHINGKNEALSFVQDLIRTLHKDD